MAILTNSSELVRANQNGWQQQMKLAIRSPEQLAERLDLPVDAIDIGHSSGQFPLFVPLPYLSRIRKGDLNDPLLKQVLPVPQENQLVEGYTTDPLAESEYQLPGGLLKKYQGRALLVCNGTCAVHCRYCFRRHFPYDQTVARVDQWQPALDELARDESIHEVILSGGDPLTLVDSVFEKLVGQIGQIAHIKRLRVHTRLPIVIPQRITAALVDCLRETRLATIFVIHANHANELDESVGQAIGKLRANSVQVLNQSVLLRGINDAVDALAELSERLFDIGVIPYYLHQLDPVSGAAHFEVSEAEGLELIEELRSRLSGYLVPKYVREIPGRPYKTELR